MTVQWAETSVYKNQSVSEMKLLQTSDIHLGKRIYGYNMAEDQRFILGRMAERVREVRPDALLIAGDVYDRAVPTEEAVSMFGDFLDAVTSEGCEVYIIAGNHDSGTRLSFCGPILGRSGIHIAGEFTGRMERHRVMDGDGELNIYLLPYFKVSEVRSRLGVDVQGYGDAMRAVLEASGVDPGERNVLVAHQFFAGSGSSPRVSESEEQRPEVGGIECIPADTLDAFDYVALGHLHIPQAVGRDTVRYCGSPLKYSASEALSPKGMVLADIRGKGSVSVETVPLEPLRDLRVLKGSLDELISAGLEDTDGRDDYIVAELTEAPGHRLPELYKVYPRTLNVSVTRRTVSGQYTPASEDPLASMDPSQLFEGFYRESTGTEMSDYQREVLYECVHGGGDVE